MQTLNSLLNECEFTSLQLDEVSEKIRGVSYSKSEASNFPSDGYVPILRANNIEDEGLNFNDLVYVPKERVSDKQYLRKGDVVVAMSSGSKRVVGKAAQLSRDWYGSFGAFCGVLRPNQQLVSPELFGNYFSTQEYRNYISEVASGTNINNLKSEHFSAIELPMPTLLSDQQLIADYLKRLLPRIVQGKEKVSTARIMLQQFRQSILSAAVTGKLTEDWRINNQNINADSLINRLETERKLYQKKEASEIAEPELPEIPNSWKWISVDSLSRLVVDGVHKTPNYQEAGIPFITVKNLTAGKGISFDDTKFITVEDHKSFTSRAKPEKGDILISKDGTLGVTRAIRTDREFSIFVSVAMIKPLLYEMTDYLELALTSQELQGQMVGVGTGLVHLVLRDLKADGIPLPPLEEQKEIVKRVNKYFDLADKVEFQITNAESKFSKLTQAVLAKTFSNEGVTI